MKNIKAIFLLIVTGVLAAPAFADTAEDKKTDNAAIATINPGNFEGDVTDAAAKISEAMRLMRRDKFFWKLDKIIDNGDTKQAEDLLGLLQSEWVKQQWAA